MVQTGWGYAVFLCYLTPQEEVHAQTATQEIPFTNVKQLIHCESD